MERKRDYAYQRAAELFDCLKPRGAFYLFPDVRRHLKNGMTSVEFAGQLLENSGVAVVPGEVFGMAGSHQNILRRFRGQTGKRI